MKEKGSKMKKIVKVSAFGLMAVMMMTGCSQKANSVVKLGDYKGVEYTPMPVEVTDEDVESKIQSLVDMNPTVIEVDREAADGDMVNIDYIGLKDGVAFEGGTGSDYDLILGSGTFIEGFEEGLIGVVAGQKISLNLTFPNDYGNEELAGQAVVFDVTVNSVKEQKPAKLNDEFIKEFTESDTLASYRETVREELLESAEDAALNQKKSDVFMKVIENSDVKVSSADVDAYFEEQLKVYEEQTKMMGIDLETMLSYSGTTVDQFKEELKTMSQQAVEQNMVAAAIFKAEGLTITDEDRDALAVEFGYGSKESMIEQVGAKTVDDFITTDKAVNFIADNAVAV